MNPYQHVMNNCGMPQTPTGVWKDLLNYLTARAAEYGGDAYTNPFEFALLNCPDTTANWRRIRSLLTELAEKHK